MAPNVLLMSKGHPFQREPFFQMFDAFQRDGEIANWTHVEQPAALAFYDPENAKDYDVIIDYSMPGVGFGRKAGDPAPEPPESFKKNIVELMEQGTHGFVYIHHNLCSWPAWEEYAHIVGGRFHYYPGSISGTDYPDSGWILGARSTYVVTVPDHPITKGLPERFELQDELYLCEVLEDEVVPLVRSDHDFSDHNFFSAYEVVGNGRMYSQKDWQHEPTSSAVCWIKNYRNSPIVYVQAGDVPTSYNNPAYRILLSNAIKWAGSDEAKAWARARNKGEAVDPKETVTVDVSPTTWPRELSAPRRDPEQPDRICLFCSQDGVERYGGVMDQHTVTKGSEEVTGPLCGNCHPLLLDPARESGGWQIKVPVA